MQIHESEQRNRGLKYKWDCVSKGIGIEIWIMEGFARDCFVEFLSSTPQSNRNILFQNKLSFHSCCRVSYEKCKRPRRNLKTKRDCNSHISLQFSYQFAIFILSIFSNRSHLRETKWETRWYISPGHQISPYQSFWRFLKKNTSTLRPNFDNFN